MKCNTCGNENVDGARFCASCGAQMGSGAATGGMSLVGQNIGGRYLVKRVLGEGGMGIVYEAEQQLGSTARKVALKTLHAHLSHDPSVSQRFHRECGTIAQLEHPNTIKVYDFGATPDGTLYIAMEFVAGKSLSQLIQESGTLPPARVLNIMRQITGSLEEAHQQGIIHRDLKPDNVVLTQRAGESDVVKLLDFGIAARTESADAQREQKLTQQGMVLGTPPYMSPEQFTGKALDARSDIYSLGVMAYEMLTGRLPFDASTPWQWATEHMMSQPIPFEATPVSSQIPAEMRSAVLRALSKNKEDRPASARQFYEELAGQGAPPVVAASHVASGTAAMAAPPGFIGGSAAGGAPRTAAMASPSQGTPAMAPTPMAVSQVAAPAIAPRKSGGKGLVIGLVSVGALLVVGIVIVAARSMKPSDEPTAEAPPTTPTAAVAPTKIDPQVEGADTAAAAAPAAVPAAEPATATGERHHGVKPKGTGGAPAATTTAATPAPTTTATATGTATATTTKPAGDTCDACLSAASSGNFAAAASAYSTCNDAGKKATCAAKVRGSAPSAANAAAMNGDCATAKRAMSAGTAMGVSPAAFKAVTASCK